MLSRTVNIILGPPGTGKTTYLVSKVRDFIGMGVQPDKIAYLAFSRKAAEVARSRIIGDVSFNLVKEDLPWFKTIHASAYKLLEITKKQVMTDEHFKQFGTNSGYVFANNYSPQMERASIDSNDIGDRSFVIYARSRAQRISVKESWERSDTADLPYHLVQKFVKDFIAFKSDSNLLDFTDMLDLSTDQLDIDVAIIDEAQDLTLQQWMCVKNMTAQAKDVIIAGDDDQAIYEFSGSTAKPLRTISAERQVLPHSYRLPANIKHLSDRVIDNVKNRFPKSYTASGREGHVQWLREASDVDLNTASESNRWLLLARNRHMLDDLEELCKNQNIVYHHNDRWSNEDSAVKAVVQYERLRRGEHLVANEFKQVLKYTGGDIIFRAPRQKWEDFKFPFQGITGYDDTNRPNWMQALHLDAAEREYIRGLRRRNISLTAPGHVWINTVHGAKGDEKENVLLLTDISRRVASSRLVDPDSEWRVLFVAVSRPIKNLFLVQPTGSNFWEF